MRFQTTLALLFLQFFVFRASTRFIAINPRPILPRPTINTPQNDTLANTTGPSNPANPASHSPRLIRHTERASATDGDTAEHTDAEQRAAAAARGLECHGPARSNVFFTHADIPGTRFNINTPWTVRYPQRLDAALRARGFLMVVVAPEGVDPDDPVVVTEDGELVRNGTQPMRVGLGGWARWSCDWRVVEYVTRNSVARGKISRTEGVGERAGEMEPPDRGLEGTVGEIRGVLEDTFPVAEIALILVFTTWPVYISLALVLVSLCSCCLCGKMI